MIHARGFLGSSRRTSLPYPNRFQEAQTRPVAIDARSSLLGTRVDQEREMGFIAIRTP